ncbi:hypothetical protein l13_20320 [Neisseria weaveri ATCC 51223]|nr:hypothetical protein l13_20320 [Neisseria weaveri ATCC 51223]
MILLAAFIAFIIHRLFNRQQKHALHEIVKVFIVAALLALAWYAWSYIVN